MNSIINLGRSGLAIFAHTLDPLNLTNSKNYTPMRGLSINYYYDWRTLFAINLTL